MLIAGAGLAGPADHDGVFASKKTRAGPPEPVGAQLGLTEGSDASEAAIGAEPAEAPAGSAPLRSRGAGSDVGFGAALPPPPPSGNTMTPKPHPPGSLGFDPEATR